VVIEFDNYIIIIIYINIYTYMFDLLTSAKVFSLTRPKELLLKQANVFAFVPGHELLNGSTRTAPTSFLA